MLVYQLYTLVKIRVKRNELKNSDTFEYKKKGETIPTSNVN